MSDSWNGTVSSDWFAGTNWTSGTVHAAPTISGTGTQSVVVNGSVANQPTISVLSANNSSTIYVAQTLITDGATVTSLKEVEIDGEAITLTNGADLSLVGVGFGTFYGNSGLTANGTTMTGLHGALTTTASYDSHMLISAIGADTLAVQTVDENFGMITVGGTGDTLTIANIIGGNAQALHGLVNYGLITVGTNGVLDITDEASTLTGTVANFYNAGWIEVAGGTADITATVLDGASTAASATGIDGYLEISQGGDLILTNTVAAQEEVTFLDSASNTLQVAAGTLFSGTVNNFGSGDTLVVLGTGVSSATLAASGTSLVATTGTTTTTIKLSGTTSSELIVGTNSAGDLVLSAGAAVLTTGTSTLGSPTVNATVTHSGTTTLTGTGTELNVYDSLAGSGTFVIQNGATLALDNTVGSDGSITVLFGTLGTATSPNELVLNGSTAGFAGTITGFSGTDVIDLGSNVLPTLTATEGLVLSYNSTTGKLSVSETADATGSVVATTTLDVLGSAGALLATGSFVALDGANGVLIETAASQSGATYNFSIASGTTGSFETAADWTGKVAPGDVIAAGEIVTIASGTASIASGGITDNGFITVASTLVDTGSLTGTGTLAIAAAGVATLTGATTLASLTDAGKLVLGGSDAVAITLASGAQATIASGFVDSAAITGLGTLTVASGVSATLAAGSTFAAVNEFGTLDLLGALATPVNLEGDAAKSRVTLAGADLISGTHTLATSFSNFGKGDNILLGTGNFSLNATTDVLSDSYANGQLVVTDSTDGAVVTIAVSLATGDLASAITLNDVGGLLDIAIPCYAAGTRLLGVDGEVAVEAIKVGDEMVTVRENGPATAKVVWVGQRTIDITRHPEPELVRPVRIQAGAFGAGLPERDLRLSPHHAVYWNGCLFEALSLVNGTTIIQEANTRAVTYHHIELEAHDVMLAEGLPAESFLDTGNKDMFEGHAAMQLHADFRAPADAQFCAPMIREGAALEAVRAELNARAAKVARAA